MANAKYFLKRFAMALLTIFLVACLTFLLMNAVPGSPWLSEKTPSAATLAADGRLMAWGELTYAKPLTEKQMEDYELKPAPGNPDRVRPSITARLKEGTRGQEPPKEPGQKRSHKNHEER